MSGGPDLLERAFCCPHCGERITAFLESAGDPRQMTVDCTVCCRAILISWGADPFTGRETLGVEPE